MQLKSITLNGFKSFPDATTFPIESPLTGIIGPNGCGKSNIIDAVRWVLGENAAKHLRAGSGSDVIFGGAAKRKASQFAQVSLHFDNKNGMAGGAFAVFDEIVMSRKINADGQSSYFINQKNVRRKDIIELLQGAGVGARSYAVIEQGMISRIIEAKPEELRGFIEEAAGISLYKSRRKESEKRMQDTEQHVLLHEERLKSLEKQRDTLEQQAQAAQVYLKLKTEHQHKHHRLRSFQLHQQNRALAELEQAYAQTQSALPEVNMAANEAALQAAQSALQTAHAAFQAASQTVEQHKSHHQNLTQQRLNEQTHAQHHQLRLQEQAARQAKLAQQSQAHAQERAERQSALQNLRQEIEQHAPELERLREAWHAQQSALSAQQQARQQHQQQTQHLTQQQTHYQHQAATLRQNLQTWHARLAQIEQSALPSVREFDEAAWQRSHSHEQQAQSALSTAQQAEQAAQQAHRTAQASAQQAREQYHRAQHQIEALSHSLPPVERAAALADLPSVWSQLTIEPRWQSALLRYLAPLLHAPYGSRPEHFQSALADAVVRGQSYAAQGNVPPAWQGIISGAVDLGLWLGHLQPLALTNDQIRAADLAEATYYLTLDGTLISRHSIAAQEVSANVMLAERLQDLQASLPALALALETAEQLCDHAQSALAAREAERQHAQQQWEHAQRERAQCDHEHALYQQEMQHRSAWLSERQQSQSALQDDIAQAQETLATLELSMETLAENWAQLEDTPPPDEEQIHALESALEQARLLFQSGEQNQRLRYQQEAHQSAWLESHALQAAQQREELAQLAESQQLLQEQALERAERLEALSVAIEESALALDTAAQTAARAEHDYHAQQQTVATLERAQLEQQSAQQLQQQRLKHLEEQREFLVKQQSALLEEMEADGRKALQFQEDEVVDLAALQREIRDLASQMENMGAVNLAAVSEFEAVRAEHAELETQCLDLRNSMALLHSAISTLDNETRTRLKTTMAQVNAHFGALFPRLFNGGEAFLSWEAGDVLDAGVNITVRPAGKKLKNITALSGGEKALSALALVFALFRLNPAPFCLLDEVDAPLDEANVGRLCALLQEMARETQFVIITHHKKTMQQCERLIGVTMSEPGVSRLVAVEVLRG